MSTEKTISEPRSQREKWHFCLKVNDDVLTTAHPARLYFGALQVCLKMRALQARADFPEGAKSGSKK
jgi:hypothetical protein